VVGCRGGLTADVNAAFPFACDAVGRTQAEEAGSPREDASGHSDPS
jgi:hypothetical protein